MKSIMQWLTKPPVDGPRSVLLLRLMVGGVFFWEGVLKFVYVNQGVGRFTKLGMPFPAFTADFVGCLEIVGGLLLLAGLLTTNRHSLCNRNDCRDALNENLDVLGDVTPSTTAVATSGRVLGGFTRNSLRICAVHGRSLPAD